MEKKSLVRSLINDLANILLRRQWEVLDDIENGKGDFLKADDVITFYRSLTFYRASLSQINNSDIAIEVVTNYLSALKYQLEFSSYDEARSELEDLRYEAGDYCIQYCDSFEKLEEIWGDRSRIKRNNHLITLEVDKHVKSFIDQYRRDP